MQRISRTCRMTHVRRLIKGSSRSLRRNNMSRFNHISRAKTTQAKSTQAKITQAKTTQAKTDKLIVVKYVLAHPFKAYFKVGGIVFGGVFLANLTNGLVTTDPPISPYGSPQVFASVNFVKSCVFGLIWPSIPFIVFNAERRLELYTLGYTTDIMLKWYEEDTEDTEDK